MKKQLKISIGILALIVLGYNSVYFRKLDEVKASRTTFDAKAYARNYFDTKLLPALSGAVEINQLLKLLQTQKEETFTSYSHALGIGNIGYFLVRGEGKVTSINENDVTLVTGTDSSQHSITIATEFIFGNAIRDASGKIDINDFTNTMDFNNVSAEINKIVRKEVLPAFKATVKQGDTVEFAGAIELNKEHLNVNDAEVVPVKLSVTGKQ